MNPNRELKLPEIVGPVATELAREIPELARSEGPVLLEGEEGTGKFLFAMHIHAAGSMREQPLLWLSAATSSLQEQRIGLLGTDFISLCSSRRGLLAQKAFLVIKQIDRTPKILQDDIADAIRTGAFLRAGSVEKSPVACRLAFTMRRPAALLAEEGILSEKLATLLTTAPSISFPPLRERREDILPIARHFLREKTLPASLEEIILSRSYGTNAKELKGLCRLLRRDLSGQGLVDPRLLEVAKAIEALEEGREISLPEVFRALENHFVALAYDKSRGSHARTARMLGLAPTTFCMRQKHLQEGIPGQLSAP